MVPTPSANPDDCDRYWDDSDRLPLGYILDRWCKQDARCKQAKLHAMLSACERGEIDYYRSDGKTFDDPVQELYERRLLLIDRDSFIAWTTRLEGCSPLSALGNSRPKPPYPAWANPNDLVFDEETWAWKRPVHPAKHLPASSIPLPVPAAPRPPWAQQQLSPIPAPVPESSASHPEQGVDEEDTNDAPGPIIGKAPAIESVPSAAIIDAFRIKADEAKNTAWWDARLRDAKRYDLLEARTAKGQLRNPSYWRPDLIAFWLVDKGHLPAKTVKHIVLRYFPDCLDQLDYLDG